MTTQTQSLGWRPNTFDERSNVVLDVHISCRLCLLETSNDDSFDIYSTIWFMEHEEDNRDESPENSIKTMLEHVTSLTMEEKDGLPRRVCKQCLNIAWKFYIFRNQVAEADFTLRKHLEAHSNNLNSCEEYTFDSRGDIEVEQIVLATDSTETNEVVKQTDPTQWNDVATALEGSEHPLLLENITFVEELERVAPEDETETCCSLNNYSNLIESDYSEKSRENFSTKNGAKPLVKNTYVKTSAKMKKAKRTQKDGKVYICHVCNRTFSLAQTLSRHAKLHESLSKNKQCSYCGKCFNRTDDLRRHIRIHTGKGFYYLKLYILYFIFYIKKNIDIYIKFSFQVKNHTAVPNARSHSNKFPN